MFFFDFTSLVNSIPHLFEFLNLNSEKLLLFRRFLKFRVYCYSQLRKRQSEACIVLHYFYVDVKQTILFFFSIFFHSLIFHACFFFSQLLCLKILHILACKNVLNYFTKLSLNVFIENNFAQTRPVSIQILRIECLA